MEQARDVGHRLVHRTHSLQLAMRKFFFQHHSGTSAPIIFCHHWSLHPLSPKLAWPFDKHNKLENIFASYASNSLWMTGM